MQILKALLLLILGLIFAVYSFAIVFAIAIIPIIRIKNERTAKISTENGLNSSIRKGLDYVFKDRRLRALAIPSASPARIDDFVRSNAIHRTAI